MDITHPAEHGRLIFRKPAISELPSVDPKLLPIEVTHLQHPMLSQEWIGMVAASPPSHQAGQPLLIAQEGPSYDHIPVSHKVPPHQQTVLQVWQNQTIIEREKETSIQDSTGPPQYPQKLRHLPLNPSYVARPF